MDQPTSPDPDERGSKRRKKIRKAGKKAVALTWREYLPMALTLAFWGVVALGIGHADAARLLAATVLIRAPLLLSQLNVAGPLRQRIGAPREARRASMRVATLIQLGVLAAIAAQVGLLTAVLEHLHQPVVAALLMIVALGMPARLARGLITGAPIRFNRLLIAGTSLGAAGVAWLLGSGPEGYAVAYACRDWLTTLIGLFLGPRTAAPAEPEQQPMTFAEVAKYSVVNSRRLLTYRLTKNVLTVFGPFGNFAARTGRGFNLHTRLEPYVPHKRGGFVIFALLTLSIAAVLIWKSGKPLAMIAGAGAVQLSALALNVLLWWRYLPVRDDPSLKMIEDDDD